MISAGEDITGSGMTANGPSAASVTVKLSAQRRQRAVRSASVTRIPSAVRDRSASQMSPRCGRRPGADFQSAGIYSRGSVPLTSHLGLPAAAAGTDQPLAPIEYGRFSVVPRGHLGWLGLDLMAAIAGHQRISDLRSLGCAVEGRPSVATADPSQTLGAPCCTLPM